MDVVDEPGIQGILDKDRLELRARDEPPCLRNRNEIGHGTTTYRDPEAPPGRDLLEYLSDVVPKLSLRDFSVRPHNAMSVAPRSRSGSGPLT